MDALMYELKKYIKNIKQVECYNIEKLENGKYYSADGNGYFIIYFKNKFNNMEINHKIIGDNVGTRIKMYYTKQPDKNFCEEQSLELGFFDGELFEDKIYLGSEKYNAIRIDIGNSPMEFEIEKFYIKNISNRSNLIKRALLILDKIKNWKNVVLFVKKNGLKKTFQTIKIVMNEELEKNTEKTNNKQVIEPYKVELKNPIKEKRKKVLHFIENFYTGGSSRLIIDIIEHYGHLYDQKIFTMAHHGEEEFLNIDIEKINVDQKEEVLKLIGSYKPDIIHVHIWESDWYNKVFDIFDLTSGYKIIENINTPVFPIKRAYIKNYIYVSNYVLNNFDKHDSKNLVIYPGSNFDIFTRELKEDYLAKDTIGMVYRLGYDKLNQHSIDVFIKTIKKRPQTKAVIVGGGPQFEYYVKKVKKAGVYENFIFTGYIPYNELVQWYERMSIFVAPVWKESFGQVSPFAMSMGIPVAGYNVGALEEIIENKDLLAEPENSDKLSDILVKLLDDYGRCISIGKKNQLRAHSLFGVKKMVDDYFQVYEKLTKGENS